MEYTNKLQATKILGYKEDRVTAVEMRIEHNAVYCGGYTDGESGAEYSNPFSVGSDLWALRELGFHHGNDEACSLHDEAMKFVQCD